MARITIGGEVVDLELTRLPLHEALALQRTTGFTPLVLGEKLAAHDMEAIAGLAWLIVHFRMGKKDVTFEHICDGTFEIDMGSFSVQEEPEDPTPAADGAAKTSRRKSSNTSRSSRTSAT